MLGADFAGALGGGGGGQRRGDRLTGQRAPRPQIGGGVDPPGGLRAAGQGPFGDRMREFAAQFCGAGLAGQVVDQLMLGHR